MNEIGYGEVYEESWWGYINGVSNFGVDYIDEGQQEQWRGSINIVFGLKKQTHTANYKIWQV